MTEGILYSDQAAEYGKAYAEAMLKGDDVNAAVYFRKYLAIPASHAVRIAFEHAAEDRRLKG